MCAIAAHSSNASNWGGRGGCLGFFVHFFSLVIRVFDEISFRKTGYETIFVFRENEGRVSRVLQFRETAEITKETIFAKHENREN
jgi:hypothetical protein